MKLRRFGEVKKVKFKEWRCPRALDVIKALGTNVDKGKSPRNKPVHREPMCTWKDKRRQGGSGGPWQT